MTGTLRHLLDQAINHIENGAKPTFGGHEKFVFRHGWLKKGVDALASNPNVFTAEDAIVVLGVGKNMVRSIRYWCLATGLFEETRGGKGVSSLRLSQLATLLLADNGWDPYLEDIGTLWLLHWQLVTNVSRALVWYLTFCTFFEIEFTKRQLSAFIAKQLKQLGVSATHATIERDVDACLRTYVPAVRKVGDNLSEEGMDCPLADLELIHFTPEDGVYRFNIGPKLTLPVEIFGFTLMAYLAKIAQSRRTVVVDECLYHQGSPGQVFKLDENSLIEYLEALEALTDGGLRLQETAGLRQLYLPHHANEWFDATAFNLLERYYAVRTAR
ncbi:MAG: DUF4007 family protein [Candidatus Caldarchaeum sp.]